MIGVAVHHDLALLRADFHAVPPCRLFQSGGEILELSFVVCHEVNVIRKAQITYRPSSDGDGCVEVVESFQHYILQVDVE